MARTKLQCMLVSHQGIGGASELRERSAELTQLDIVRLELHRLAKGLRRLLLPSLRGSKARQIMRLGVLSDRVRDPLYQAMVLFGVEEQQTHQVQRVRMIGIRCKRLLAAELGVEVSFGLHMSKAGFIKRGRGAYARLVHPLGASDHRAFANRSSLGFLAGRPPFATLHGLFSK